MSRVGVVAVPFVFAEQHYLFMVQTVISLLQMKTSHTLDLVAIVNYFRRPQAEFKWLETTFDVVELNDRNNLARAWNKGIEKVFERGADYALVINLDVVFHELFIENLVKFAKDNQDVLIWSGQPWSDQETLQNASLDGAVNSDLAFSCFMIDRQLFDKVGRFDEQFDPAYHEDSDMLYRIKLSGGKVQTTPSARFFHIDRATIKGATEEKEQAFLDSLRVMMDKSMERYAAKWGGLPGREKFLSPFGK